MKGLLDTHTFIWWDSQPARLSPGTLAFITDPANSILLSVASVWGIVIKQQLGKLSLTSSLQHILAQQQSQGLHILPVTLQHVMAVSQLPPIHRDPFDRLIAAQAIAESATLLTADPVFEKYPVNVIL